MAMVGLSFTMKNTLIANTKLQDGDTFGSEHNIAGYEVDGATIDWSLTEGEVQIIPYPKISISLPMPFQNAPIKRMAWVLSSPINRIKWMHL